MRREGRLRQMSWRAGMLLAMATTAGCQSASTGTTLAENNYRLQHPIVIAEKTETLDLPIGANMRRLPRQMGSTVSEFARQARVSGGGTVELLTPSGGANEAAVHALTPQLRKAVAAGGIARGRIVTRSYPVEDMSVSAPIRLAYNRMAAQTNECGRWPDDVSGNFSNTNYYNFGCATQSNLAAAIDNPSDLLGPRPSTPADAMRRGVVFEKYRKGEITASEYKQGVGAEISDVGN